MLNIDLQKLTQFHKRASESTYAGNGKYVEPQRPGFNELIYEENDLKYRDSYCGFFQSWGEEVIWQNNEVIWTCLYGGGMKNKFHGDKEFASQTFEFLKKAMKAKEESFSPRGPKYFKDEDYEYSAYWSGDISNYSGNEKILYKGEIVFTHTFFGGLVK